MARFTGYLMFVLFIVCLVFQLAYTYVDNYEKATYYVALSILFLILTKENLEK